MEEELIYRGQATIEDLETLHGLGFEFVIEDGCVTGIVTGKL